MGEPAVSKDPWIKWFPGDFLGGVSELEPNEGWVYTVVLNLIYDGGGPWLLNLDRLARRCRMRPTSAQKALDALYSYGKLTLIDGHLSNGKAEKSLKSRQKVSENSAEAAHARWEKERSKGNENNDPHHADAMPTQCTDDANQKLEARSQNISEAKASSVAASDVAKAFAEWNVLAERLSLPIAKTLTPQRRKVIKTRLTADGLDGWRDALAGVEASPHCRGENDRGWKADLDFVAQPKSFQRLRERFYGGEQVSDGSGQLPTTWSGPPAVRQSVVAAKGEDFAAKWLDPYCSWSPTDRTLLVTNAYAAKQISQELGAEWFARKDAHLAIAPANTNDAPLLAHGAAA